VPNTAGQIGPDLLGSQNGCFFSCEEQKQLASIDDNPPDIDYDCFWISVKMPLCSLRSVSATVFLPLPEREPTTPVGTENIATWAAFACSDERLFEVINFFFLNVTSPSTPNASARQMSEGHKASNQMIAALEMRPGKYVDFSLSIVSGFRTCEFLPEHTVPMTKDSSEPLQYQGRCWLM
jgi:hypothetical protein